MKLPEGWTNIMPVECMYGCGVFWYKDGGGVESPTTGICPQCVAEGRTGLVSQ